ncbi:MAG: hypothetical protein WC889_19540, partial [Myxococcota bacterium]
MRVLGALTACLVLFSSFSVAAAEVTVPKTAAEPAIAAPVKQDPPIEAAGAVPKPVAEKPAATELKKEASGNTAFALRFTPLMIEDIIGIVSSKYGNLVSNMRPSIAAGVYTNQFAVRLLLGVNGYTQTTTSHSTYPAPSTTTYTSSLTGVQFGGELAYYFLPADKGAFAPYVTARVAKTWYVASSSDKDHKPSIPEGPLSIGG